MRRRDLLSLAPGGSGWINPDALHTGEESCQTKLHQSLRHRLNGWQIMALKKTSIPMTLQGLSPRRRGAPVAIMLY